MSDMTLREQMYRRWKKGEDYCVLAKEMGVTRERMQIMLKRMDADVPLMDRIEELEAKLAKLIRGAEAVIEAWEVLTATGEGGSWPVAVEEMRAHVAEAKGAKP